MSAEATWCSRRTRGTLGELRTTTRAAMRRALESPFVVHYTGASKPWEYLNVHPFRELYFRYLERTPWRGHRPRRTPLKIAKRRIATSRIGTRLDRWTGFEPLV